MTNRDPTPDGEVYSTQYDVTSHDSLCFTIVRAVSALTGDAPETVEPLYETIDPDALEDVIRSLQRDGGGDVHGTVEFTLHGCQVTVTADGTIELRPAAVSSDQSHSDENSD